MNYNRLFCIRLLFLSHLILFCGVVSFVYSQEVAPQSVRQRLVVVPLSADLDGQIVSDLLAQKMLVFLQENKAVVKEFFSWATFSVLSKGTDTNFSTLAKKYFNQGNNVVVIVWVYKNEQGNTQSENYDSRILFFQESEDKKLVETKVQTSLNETITANDFFSIMSPLERPNFVSVLLDISSLQFYIRAADIRFIPVWEKKARTPQYTVTVNGKNTGGNSPKVITVNKQKNYVEILQKQIVVGSFVIRLTTSEFFVKVPLLDDEELAKKEKSLEAKYPHTNSMITVDFLFGGFVPVFSGAAVNNTISEDDLGFTDAMGGTMKFGVEPMPYLRLGLDVPFGFSIGREQFETQPNFMVLAGTIGAVIPIIKGFEIAINVGGGAFFLNQVGKGLVTQKSIEKQSIFPLFASGLDLAYNVPIKKAGYMRVLLGTTAYVSFINVSKPLLDESGDPLVSEDGGIRVSAGTVQTVYLGVFAGLGWRF